MFLCLVYKALTEPSFPDGFVLSFPMRTNYMYGLVRKEITEMYAFTACVWLKAKEGGIGTPFSYSVPGQPNELVLLQGVHNPVELLINDKVQKCFHQIRVRTSNRVTYILLPSLLKPFNLGFRNDRIPSKTSFHADENDNRHLKTHKVIQTSGFSLFTVHLKMCLPYPPTGRWHSCLCHCHKTSGNTSV